RVRQRAAGLRAHRGGGAVRAGHRLHDPVRVLSTTMRRSVYGALAAGLAAFAASGTVLAKEGSGGMPQLDPSSFAPQLVWLAIAFLALYLVMSRLAVPAISDTIDRRQAKIQGDLDAAEKANEDTRSL